MTQGYRLRIVTDEILKYFPRDTLHVFCGEDGNPLVAQSPKGLDCFWVAEHELTDWDCATQKFLEDLLLNGLNPKTPFQGTTGDGVDVLLN